MKNFDRNYLFLILPLAAFLVIALKLNFFQDDAYISYRYVANFLNGNGLVFNIGERIEGFTNFGWVVYLALCGVVGLNYILLSKITGLILGAGFIVITYLTAKLIFEDKDRFYALLPPFLLGATAALAYWAQSGLETAAFSFFAALSFYFYLKRSWWLIFALTLSVWVRPEGALVAGLLIITEIVVNKRFPKFAFYSALSAFVLSLPFVFFKIFYYGSILPNPFFAKTGWTMEQFYAGLDYAGTFFKHYGFYGAGFVITLIAFSRLKVKAREILIITVVYICYIIIIGGDVLKVHRFFLPIIGLSGIIAAQSLQILLAKLTRKSQMLALLAVSTGLLALTYMLPREFVESYMRREQGLTYAMQSIADDIRETGPPKMTIATSTIGIFSYELLGQTVIDVLGLTDSTIARHPQKEIPGIESTWRERKYNATYVLSRSPDYIVFSTGDKPSAPAEQALLLYRQFMDSYVTLDFHHHNKKYAAGTILLPVYKKVRPLVGDPVPTYPAEYVKYYKKGRELYSDKKFDEALALFDSAIAVSPEPPYKYLNVAKAMCYFYEEKHNMTQLLMFNVLGQDSLVYDAHKYLLFYARIARKPEAVAFHRSFIEKLAPWTLPYIDSIANVLVESSRR